MKTRPSRKKRKAAGRKSANKSAGGKATAKKAPAGKKKSSKVAAKARGKGTARRATPPKARQKPKAKSSARRGGTPGRHLLTSVRRPKVRALRGPSRTRVVARRNQAKRSAGARASAGAAVVERVIRDFAAADAAAVNAVALAAFEQYRGEYQDWPAFSAFVGAMADLAESGELIVAEIDGRIAGAVAYFEPRAAKPALFDPDWPVIRMLVVDPAARGRGVGRMLTEECIRRARRDGAEVIALHTSPIMQVALALYLRSGFVPLRDSPPIFGVPYRIYLKRLQRAAREAIASTPPPQ
jgi:ribosomal protein S18 acetylase RimI-like enzyme